MKGLRRGEDGGRREGKKETVIAKKGGNGLGCKG